MLSTDTSIASQLGNVKKHSINEVKNVSALSKLTNDVTSSSSSTTTTSPNTTSPSDTTSSSPSQSPSHHTPTESNKQSTTSISEQPKRHSYTNGDGLVLQSHVPQNIKRLIFL